MEQDRPDPPSLLLSPLSPLFLFFRSCCCLDEFGGVGVPVDREREKRNETSTLFVGAQSR